MRAALVFVGALAGDGVAGVVGQHFAPYASLAVALPVCVMGALLGGVIGVAAAQRMSLQWTNRTVPSGSLEKSSTTTS